MSGGYQGKSGGLLFAGATRLCLIGVIPLPEGRFGPGRSGKRWERRGPFGSKRTEGILLAKSLDLFGYCDTCIYTVHNYSSTLVGPENTKY